MWIKILAALAVVVGVFCIVAAKQPDEFSVMRSTTIAASPAAVFAEVNNLHRWEAWSPWAKLDPNAQSSFEGPKEGKGAIMRWAGNYKVGAGSMTVVESVPSKKVKFRLDFLKPLPGINTAEFTFTPKAKQTEVIWSMQGQQNFIGKAMGLIFNCQKMVGEQFEKGLADLKTVVEQKAAAK